MGGSSVATASPPPKRGTAGVAPARRSVGSDVAPREVRRASGVKPCSISGAWGGVQGAAGEAWGYGRQLGEGCSGGGGRRRADACGTDGTPTKRWHGAAPALCTYLSSHIQPFFPPHVSQQGGQSVVHACGAGWERQAAAGGERGENGQPQATGGGGQSARSDDLEEFLHASWEGLGPAESAGAKFGRDATHWAAAERPLHLQAFFNGV